MKVLNSKNNNNAADPGEGKISKKAKKFALDFLSGRRGDLEGRMQSLTTQVKFEAEQEKTNKQNYNINSEGSATVKWDNNTINDDIVLQEKSFQKPYYGGWFIEHVIKYF